MGRVLVPLGKDPQADVAGRVGAATEAVGVGVRAALSLPQEEAKAAVVEGRGRVETFLCGHLVLLTLVSVMPM